MDWSAMDPRQIVTSSLDGTCCVWDIETKKLKTQLIAHDNNVFDVAWNPHQSNVFTTVGRDGSVRVFDLNALDHSTIVFEESQKPILRLAIHLLFPNYIALLTHEGHSVQIIDTRRPGLTISENVGEACHIEWSLHSRLALNISSKTIHAIHD
jgi:WD repeat-containing protein 68